MLILHAPNGAEYSVHSGLPEELAMPMGEDYLLYFPPQEPHIFRADRFILEDGKNVDHPIIDQPNLTVLFMHGEWQNGSWVPKDPHLQAQGITIPNIVSGYEQASGNRLDVLFVCKTGSTIETATEPEIDTAYPYIHSRYGKATGRIFKQAGEVTVVLSAGTLQTYTDYQAWQDRQH